MRLPGVSKPGSTKKVKPLCVPTQQRRDRLMQQPAPRPVDRMLHNCPSPLLAVRFLQPREGNLLQPRDPVHLRVLLLRLVLVCQI